MEELDRKSDYERVSFKAKIIQLGDPIKVGAGLQKQDVTISDQTGAAKLTVWEKNIGLLSLDSSYEFSQFIVQTYRNEKSLSWPKEGASFAPIDDKGVIAEDDLPETCTTHRSAKSSECFPYSTQDYTLREQGAHVGLF